MAIHEFVPDGFEFITPIIAGQSWPAANEDDYAAAAQAYADAISSLIATATDSGLSFQQVDLNVNAVSSEAFAQHWSRFVSMIPAGSGDRAAVLALIDQYEKLGRQALDARTSTEYTKLVINIQIVLVAIQLAIIAISAFFTFGASTAEAGPAIAIAQFVSRNAAFRLVQEIMMAAVPDFVAQSIQLTEHHVDSYNVEQIGVSLLAGTVGGVLGMGAGALTTRLAESSSPLWSFIGNQAHQWYGRSAEGALNNVLTSGLMDSGKLLSGQMTGADWQALLFAGVNGGFTGLAFHAAGSLGGHSTKTLLFTADDGTVYRGREVSPGNFRFFTDKGWLTATGQLGEDGTLDVRGFWTGDDSSIALTSLEVRYGNTSTVYTVGDDGEFTPQRTTVTGDGKPYTLPSGDQVPLGRGEQLTVHYPDTPVPTRETGGHRLLTDSLTPRDPFAVTVATPTGTRIYDGTGAPIGTRTADGFEAARGYEVQSSRITLGPSQVDALVTTFRQDGQAVLTITGAGRSIALTPGDTLPAQAGDWRLSALDAATAASVVQIGVFSALARGEMPFTPAVRDVFVEETAPRSTELVGALVRELAADSDPARAALRQQVLDAAARLETAAEAASDSHPGELAEVGGGLARRTIDALRAAYHDLTTAGADTIAEVQARTELERHLVMADETARALVTLAAQTDLAPARVWQQMGRTPAPHNDGDPLYDGVFWLDKGHELLPLTASHDVVAERERAAIGIIRAWYERGQAQRLAEQLARPAAGDTGAAPVREPAVRSKLLVVDPGKIVLEGLKEMFPGRYIQILADRSVARWTLPGGQDPLLLVAESGIDPVFSVPSRTLRDGTPIQPYHIDDRVAYLDLRAREAAAATERDQQRAELNDLIQQQRALIAAGQRPLTEGEQAARDAKSRTAASAVHEYDRLNRAARTMEKAYPYVKDEYWPYHDLEIGLDLVAPASSTALTVLHTSRGAEYETVAARHQLARDIVDVTPALHDLADQLAPLHPDPRRIGTTLDTAVRQGLITPALRDALTIQQRRAVPDPDALIDRVDALVNAGHLTVDQGTLVLGAAENAALFHSQVDLLAQTGVAQPVIDALHATGLAHGLDELTRAGERQTQVALVDDLFATDSPSVLRERIDAELKQADAVKRLLQPPGDDQRRALRGLSVEDRHDLYQQVLDRLVDRLNRYPTELMPALPEPIDPATGEVAAPGSAARHAWDQLVSELRGDPWTDLRRSIVDMRSVPGMTYGPRSHDAETKLFYALSRVFEAHRPPPGTELVIMSDKAMCAGCQAAGTFLADRYGVRVTVVDPPADINPMPSGLEISPRDSHIETAFARQIRPEAGVVNLAIHADRDGLILGGRRLSVAEFVGLVPPDTIPPGAVLRFLSCDLGKNQPLMHELANIYGRDVVAADSPVWIDSDGNVIAALPRPTQYGSVPAIEEGHPPDGTWYTAKPFDPNIYVNEHVPYASESIYRTEKWSLMLHEFEHESTMDETLARLAQLQTELAHLPIEHAREMARLNQVIVDAQAAYQQAEAQFTREADEATGQAQQHMADVLAAAAPNRPVGEPPASFYTSSTELTQQLQHLQATAPPLAEVRRAVETAQTVLSTRDTLVAKLRELGSRPAGELTPAQAVEAEHAMRAVTALDSQIRSLGSDPRFQDPAVEQRVRGALPPDADVDLAVWAARLRTADATAWSPRLEEQGDRDLSRLLAEERELRGKLEAARDMPQLRRLLGTEADLMWVDTHELRDQLAAVRQRISDQVTRLRGFDHDVRDAATDLRRAGPGNPIQDFLARLAPPPIDPAGLEALKQLTVPALAGWDAQMEKVTRALAATLYSPETDINDPRFNPAALADATVTEWKPLKLSPAIPTSGRDSIVARLEDRVPERGPYGDPIPRGLPLLVLDHADGWRSVLRGIGHGDLIGLLAGITGASSREIAPLRLEERTITVGTATWREVRTVYQITEERGSLGQPYTSKTRGVGPDNLPQPELGPAQVKVQLTAQERVQFIPAGKVQVRWERSIVERTLVDDGGRADLPRFQRMVEDKPAQVTLFEHPSIEVQQMLRAAAEVRVPLTGLGPLGPQAVGSVAMEAAHTESVPLLNGVEARAQFHDLVAQLMAAPVPGLTEGGRQFWQGAVNDTLGATGRQHLELQLDLFVKQALLGQAAVDLGNASPIPFENLEDVSIWHQWFTWSIELPDGAPPPVQVVGDVVGEVATQAQTFATNPVRMIHDLPQSIADTANQIAKHLHVRKGSDGQT